MAETRGEKRVGQFRKRINKIAEEIEKECRLLNEPIKQILKEAVSITLISIREFISYFKTEKASVFFGNKSRSLSPRSLHLAISLKDSPFLND